MRAERPSSTARLILRSMLLCAQHPDYRCLVPAGDDVRLRQLLEKSGRTRWFDFALRNDWAARVLWLAERAILPGIFLHYLARKSWFERIVRRAIAHGARQIVILGAGFDTLAWRVHLQHPHIFFCELDHPATQSVKAAAIAAGPAGSNFTMHAVDLANTDPLQALSTEPRFDSRLPTCFVAEGLLMYFSAERVMALLRSLGTISGATAAFTFMAPGPDGRASFRGATYSINAWLHLVREPFAWAISPAELDNFLSRAGWHVASISGAPEIRTEILAPAGLAGARLAQGEYLCVSHSCRERTPSS
jgi:methyltransferase (TIGR00027 family)